MSEGGRERHRKGLFSAKASLETLFRNGSTRRDGFKYAQMFLRTHTDTRTYVRQSARSLWPALYRSPSPLSLAPNRKRDFDCALGLIDGFSLSRLLFYHEGEREARYAQRLSSRKLTSYVGGFWFWFSLF